MVETIFHRFILRGLTIFSLHVHLLGDTRQLETRVAAAYAVGVW